MDDGKHGIINDGGRNLFADFSEVAERTGGEWAAQGSAAGGATWQGAGSRQQREAWQGAGSRQQREAAAATSFPRSTMFLPPASPPCLPPLKPC